MAGAHMMAQFGQFTLHVPYMYAHVVPTPTPRSLLFLSYIHLITNPDRRPRSFWPLLNGSPPPRVGLTRQVVSLLHVIQMQRAATALPGVLLDGCCADTRLFERVARSNWSRNTSCGHLPLGTACAVGRTSVRAFAPVLLRTVLRLDRTTSIPHLLGLGISVQQPASPHLLPSTISTQQRLPLCPHLVAVRAGPGI